MRVQRLGCVAASLLAGLLLAAGAVRLASASSAAAPAASAAGPETAERLAASVPVTCSATSRITHTRQVAAWYGSTFVAGSAVTNVTELSDHLSAGLASVIYNDSRQDLRLRNGLGDWVTSTTDISWTLETGENLPAAANLRARLGSVAPPPPFNAIHLDQLNNRGTFTYLISTWIEDIGGCPYDAFGQARVAYVEQNARAVRPLYLPLIRR